MTTRNSLDLEDDWRTLRQKPAASSSAPAEKPMDFEADWNVLKNLPEFVYFGGANPDHFSLWKLRVHGEKRLARTSRAVDCWIVTKEQVIFQWGKFDNGGSGRYVIPKIECTLTLEESAAKFERFRTVHEESLRLAITRLENEVRKGLKGIKTFRAQLESLQKVQLDAASLKRDGLRSQLLNVLVQRNAQVELEDDLADWKAWTEAL